MNSCKVPHLQDLLTQHLQLLQVSLVRADVQAVEDARPQLETERVWVCEDLVTHLHSHVVVARVVLQQEGRKCFI